MTRCSYPILGITPKQDVWGILVVQFSKHRSFQNVRYRYRTLHWFAECVVGLIRETQGMHLVSILAYPLLLFIVFLVLAMVILSGALIRIWNKRVELLAGIDQQKNSVIHTVAHLLNTLVSGLKWSAEMLRSGDTTKEACADTVETETAELKDLAAMFLEAAHIQKGQLEIKRVPLNLKSFFQEIIKEARNQAHEMKVTLNIFVPSALGGTISCDEWMKFLAIPRNNDPENRRNLRFRRTTWIDVVESERQDGMRQTPEMASAWAEAEFTKTEICNRTNSMRTSLRTKATLIRPERQLRLCASPVSDL